MGVINAANLLKFKSSDSMFARIEKRLGSFTSLNLLDTGDFHHYVKKVLNDLGQGAMQECEAVLPVENFKAKLPDNFSTFYSAFRCSFNSRKRKENPVEQRNWIYYHDTEITPNYYKNDCTISCEGDSHDKIVIRTYVNDVEDSCATGNLCMLKLSPNVRKLCEDDCMNLFGAGSDEITVKDGYIYTTFDQDSIYIQYYGLPVDEHGLPMIPDNTHIEGAIEYYIYSQIFEELYWNSTVPGIANALSDARQQYIFNNGMAANFVNLPSFQTVLQSIRRMRNNKKFYQLGEYKTQG